MRIKCNTEDLKKVLNTIKKAVPVRTPSAVLECVNIVVKDEIKFTATDRFNQICSNMEGTIEEKGEVNVNAALLVGISNRLPEGEITLITDDGKFYIVGEYNTFSLPIVEGDFNPIKPKFAPEKEVDLVGHPIKRGLTMNGKLFKRLVEGTCFLTPWNNENHISDNLAFDASGQMRGLSNFAGAKMTFEAVGDMWQMMYLPITSMQKLISILGDEDMDIVWNTKWVKFITNDFEFICSTREGNFYNMDELFYMEPETTAKVNRKELINAIETLNLFNREECKHVSFTFTEGELTLNIETSFGDGEEKPTTESTGGDANAWLNGYEFVNILKHIEDDEVTINLNEDYKKPVRVVGDDYAYLLLQVAKEPIEPRKHRGFKKTRKPLIVAPDGEY